MLTAFYPGSFDPPTLGHLDLIRRAVALFDVLFVAIASNPDKPSFLPSQLRLRILHDDLKGIQGLRVVSYSGATVTFAKKVGANVLLRGLRHGGDLDYERPMSEVNKTNGLETLFMLPSPQFMHVSSSVVRRAIGAGLPLRGLVSSRAMEVIKLHQHGVRDLGEQAPGANGTDDTAGL